MKIKTDSIIEKKEDKGFTLSAIPTYDIQSDGFRVRNFGNQYFFPEKKLQEGLEEVIIFTENHKKYDIPNGSVWVYDKNQEYKPEILREDIGCGITAYITESISYDKNTASEILNVLEEEKILIGGGNHFIDFGDSHPLVQNSSMVFLHSDYNPDNSYPNNYEEAKERVNISKDKRIEKMELMFKKLGLGAKYYNDWTHNTISEKDDYIIYQKGAINTKETNSEGILALNPYSGICMYHSDWNNYHGMMQHGTGKKTAKKFFDKKHAITSDNYVALSLVDCDKMPREIYDVYNNMDDFNKQFGLEKRTLGFVIPQVSIFSL